MNRLQSELTRLYRPGSAIAAGADAPPFDLFDEQGRTRALVLELTRPADWGVLSKVWTAVQLELELPAPAIAVSGVDGLQLWFSLAVPISVRRAHAFLAALCARLLPAVDAGRFRLLPTAHQPPRHAARVPGLQDATGNWSAFVAPDLAAVFAETPWLDIEPGGDGQAALLHGLRSIDKAAFETASKRLGMDIVPTADPARAPANAPGSGVKPILNLDELEFKAQAHGDTFQASQVNVSGRLGAAQLGYGVTCLAAGKRAWPFHNHHANEEMFFVLAGTGTYRIGGASWPIRAGDFIAAPAGDRGTAHQIVNDSDAELRYIAVSTQIRPEIVEYPDSNKFSASSGASFGHVGTKSDAVDYWLGES